jgi:hypothetical protein
VGPCKRRSWLARSIVACVLASAAWAHGIEPTPLVAGRAPWQVPPTPPFPTLAPTEPFPTLPPNVPTPSLFTPTATRTSTPTGSPTSAVPSPSASPTTTPTPTIGLDLMVPIYLPYLAQGHLFLEPSR